jgi:hypothetical protein
LVPAKEESILPERFRSVTDRSPEMPTPPVNVEVAAEVTSSFPAEEMGPEEKMAAAFRRVLTFNRGMVEVAAPVTVSLPEVRKSPPRLREVALRLVALILPANVLVPAKVESILPEAFKPAVLSRVAIFN